ncbi:unnamed protein product, partial [Effrenium voratum]
GPGAAAELALGAAFSRLPPRILSEREQRSWLHRKRRDCSVRHLGIFQEEADAWGRRRIHRLQGHRLQVGVYRQRPRPCAVQ